jgi:hypothetical protein
MIKYLSDKDIKIGYHYKTIEELNEYHYTYFYENLFIPEKFIVIHKRNNDEYKIIKTMFDNEDRTIYTKKELENKIKQYEGLL